MTPRPAVPEWVHKMNAFLARYAVPLVFGNRPRRGQVADINAATGVAIDFGTACVLLSAGHVISAAVDRLRGPGCHFMAGPIELELEPDRIHMSGDPDIAALRLTREELSALESDGLYIVRPQAWPPSAPRQGETVVLAGFPGPWRLQLSWDEFDFRSFTMLALVHEVRESEFICHLEPEFLVERTMTPHEPLPPLGLPGLSGGPTFLVQEDRIAPIAPQLCGIVTEGLDLGDQNLIVRFARLDCVDQTGGIVERGRG